MSRKWLRVMNIIKNIKSYLSFKIKYLKSSLRGFFLNKNVTALIVNTSQGVFAVDPKDISVGRALLKSGEYGLDEVQRIVKLAGPNGKVLFVGTHLGAIAIPVSKSVAKVTAVEANPNTFKLLEYNKRLNGCHNMELLQMAAGEVNGEINFLLNTANSGGSKRVPAVKKINYVYDSPEIVKVKLRVLDELLKDSFDLILMDIEGSEYFALKGMQSLLASVRILIVEFVPDHLRNVSSVSASDFLELIEPHFNSLYIPSVGITVAKKDFSRKLNEMYSANISDNGIVFSK